MKRVIENVLHCKGNVCFIISLRDLFAYHGHDFSEAIMCGLGGISFFYFKFKRAKPPVQIFPGYLEPRRFLYAVFLRAASRHLKVPALDESATFFVEAGHGWNKVSEILERTSTSETKQELKTLLRVAAETISQISDIEERAFRLLDGI